MKKFISVLCLLFVLITVVALPVEAASMYQTYTYSIDGKALHSPDAYVAQTTVDAAAMGLDFSLLDAKDIAVDEDGNVYVVDTGNSRVICLDPYYRVRKFADGSDMIIDTFLNGQAIEDNFNEPEGIFVSKSREIGGEVVPGRIFVCDTKNFRIVTFTMDGLLEGKCESIIGKPESQLFESDSVYYPVAVAVDDYDRMFVVSSETNEGVIVMTDDGVFTGFIGAQQSVSSVWDQIWRRFQTDKQREQAEAVISYPYNNVDINERGFIYVTIYTDDLMSQMAAALKTAAGERSGTYAPCKLLNPAGDEIMRRNGFWPPAGEIDYQNKYVPTLTGVSEITDVACGPEETWTIIDEKRGKLYTYDYDGNLLFAFGDQGSQLGNLSHVQAITYQGDKMLVLDGTGKNQRLTVFRREEYGDALISALRCQNERRYEDAIEAWKEILMRNSNYDAAYIGIGNAMFRNGAFEEALEYYKAAYDTANYSVAYKEMRKEWITKFFLLIPVVIGAAAFGIVKLLGYADKVNKRASTAGGKRTFKEELFYVFHVMFHPFDGFWDLKHEKRGSLRAALVFMGLTVIALFYRSVGIGYVMNPQGNYSTIFMQFLVVAVPILLFAVANWCLTTLFEGEGNFKEIVIAIGYSLLPIPITMIPATLISNYVVDSEVKLLNLVITLGFLYAAFLIFFGTMVTHDYSMSKNILTVAGTIVGMAFIMFIAILFTSLVMDIVTFVSNYVSEITFRL